MATWDDMRQQVATKSAAAYYDSARAKATRDGAIDAVGAGASPEWIAAAMAAVTEAAGVYQLFTTDHVLAAHPELESCEEPRAWGRVMRQAQTTGVCTATDAHWLSKRVKSHGRPKRVWRSLIGGTADSRLFNESAQ